MTTTVDGLVEDKKATHDKLTTATVQSSVILLRVCAAYFHAYWAAQNRYIMPRRGRRTKTKMKRNRIEMTLCQWLKVKYPDVLVGMQSDNRNYHGHRPPYIDDEEGLCSNVASNWLKCS